MKKVVAPPPGPSERGLSLRKLPIKLSKNKVGYFLSAKPFKVVSTASKTSLPCRAISTA